MPRALLALLAIAVCGWFGLGAVQARDIDRARTLLSAGSHIDGTTAARVASLLHGAQVLNPDRGVDMLRARLDDERGAKRQGEQVLRRILAAEPRNAQAWALLAQSATDRATLRLAFANIESLVPPVHASR